MARARTAPEVPAPLEVPKGFVASAASLPTSSRNQAGRLEGWQTRAWEFWRSVGELRALATWTGNVLSRGRLVPAQRVGRALVPITDGNHPAVEAMEAFYGGPQGQAEALKLYGEHSTVAGEEYIVYRAKKGDWNTLAAGKVTQRVGARRTATGARALAADFGKEGGSEDLEDGDLVIRIWIPDPTDPTRANAPTRSVLTTLEQIVAYDMHIAAQIQSRLAGNGILFMSNEVDFPAPEGADPNASQAHNFMKMIAEAMEAAKADPGGPAAKVPIIAMVPPEALGNNEWMTFWSELDNSVIEMRDASIKRLALGMDAPPEVLLGVGDQNHWNAWLSEESAVKAQIEPKLATFAFGVTEQYLRPALSGVLPKIEDYFVIADTASIRLRPNRSEEAIELYDRGELSGEALRRETGFQPEDAPAQEEFTRWLLKRIATGAVTPEQTAFAMQVLGVDMPIELGGELQQPPNHVRINTVPQTETRDMPSIDDARARAENIAGDGLVAACEVLLFRALERAGNRLKNHHRRTVDLTRLASAEVYQHVPPGDPDDLLAGAWDCAVDVLGDYADDIPAVVATLDFYCRGLLNTKRKPSRAVLAALLNSAPNALPAGSS